jgi:hypothetical protein
MRIRPRSQELNLVFAWAGALAGTAFELCHAWVAIDSSPSLFVLFVAALLLLVALSKTRARWGLTLGLSAALGFICTGITFSLIA